MKALIIGAAGFVGGHLIRHLRDERGWSVTATKLPAEKIVSPGVDVSDLDILKPYAVKELLMRIQPDCVFHLAAQSSVSLSWEKPELTIDINIKGSLNVLEALRGTKSRLLLIGSGEEYGRTLESETLINEKSAARPGNIYAATKAFQGMLGKIYADAYDLDVIMVRAFNHIGPGQAPYFVVSDFCKQVAEIEAGKHSPAIRVGNLSAKRDFTDVRDVVRAYSLLIEKGQKGETYNVGSGNAVSVKDILDMILKEASLPIIIETDAGKLRPVDVHAVDVDTKKLVSATGWKREIELRQSVHDTLEYWRKLQ